MLFKNITILDEHLDVRENQYVATKGGRIVYIGSEPPAEVFEKEYEGKDKLLMSAFQNAHAHTPMTLLRGYAENMALSDWLNKKIFPFESKLNEADIYYGMLLGIAEMLRFGIVSTTDMYYNGERMAAAVLESGFKSNISLGMTCFSDKNLSDLAIYEESKALFRDVHNAGDGRVKVDMSIHAEYTSTPKVVRQMAEFCKSIGANMHLHLSETSFEHEGCKQRHEGKTPTRYFYDLGVFDSPTTAAHCIWLENEDFDLLAEKGVTAATNPISNLKLASGICNAPKMYEKGINVALGTDSVASNNSLNFIEEMKFFSLIQKNRASDPTVITPKQTIKAATAAGAISQGRTDTGVLKVGNRADLIVLDISGAHMNPVHDLRNNLVYSASGSDVVLTMADGRVLYENGEHTTIDVERAIYEVERGKDRIIKELKTPKDF